MHTYEITLGDGRILRADNLLALAGLWAEAEHTPEEWAALTRFQRNCEISFALDALDLALREGQ